MFYLLKWLKYTKILYLILKGFLHIFGSSIHLYDSSFNLTTDLSSISFATWTEILWRAPRTKFSCKPGYTISKIWWEVHYPSYLIAAIILSSLI